MKFFKNVLPRFELNPCRLNSFAGNRSWGLLFLGTLILLVSCAGADPYEPGSRPEITFSEDLNALYFIDGREGWAVGDQGSLVHTNNGGATWQLRDIGTRRDLHDITFVDSNNGWIVGEGGMIMRTASAGLGWVKQESQTPETLNSVKFLNLHTGWAVGENGTILFTTNGGLLWTPQPGGESHRLNDVYFRDINTGWIVGDRGLVMFTQEGSLGGFWRLQISGTSRNLNAIQWNGKNAFAVGAEGVMIKTGRGALGGSGQWISLPPTVTLGSISNVFFMDPSRGWVVSRGGVILYTDNGGLSWMDRSPASPSPLNAVYFNSAKVGWAAGEDGTILYSVDGGMFWIKQRVY